MYNMNFVVFLRNSLVCIRFQKEILNTIFKYYILERNFNFKSLTLKTHLLAKASFLFFSIKRTQTIVFPVWRYLGLGSWGPCRPFSSHFFSKTSIILTRLCHDRVAMLSFWLMIIANMAPEAYSCKYSSPSFGQLDFSFAILVSIPVNNIFSLSSR